MILSDYIREHVDYPKQLVLDAIPYLEAQRPDWRTAVDWGRFDLSSPAHCILGQLFGGYHRGLTVLFGDNEANRTLGSDPANIEVYAFASEQCQDEWRNQAGLVSA